MIRDLLTSVCNQNPFGTLSFCPYCVGIYSAIAASFPLFLWIWTRGPAPPLKIFVAGGLAVLALMCIEFTLHYRGQWSLPAGAKLAIGVGNGAAFGIIGAYFWHRLLGERISLKKSLVFFACAAGVCALSARSLVEIPLFTGVVIRYVVANTLLLAAIFRGARMPGWVWPAAGLLLAIAEWWVFRVTA